MEIANDDPINPAILNWQQGEELVIVPAVSDEDAKKKYPYGWKSPLPYIRVVPQP